MDTICRYNQKRKKIKGIRKQAKLKMLWNVDKTNIEADKSFTNFRIYALIIQYCSVDIAEFFRDRSLRLSQDK